MNLALARTLEDLRPVLMDPSALGPETVYWVFDQSTLDNRWQNMTVITPGLLGREFPKTFGHYHGVMIDEIYTEVLGRGLLLLQKKVLRSGQFVPDEVSEVLIIQAGHGDKVTIPPEYGHFWSNVGPDPIITFDDWRVGHQPSDYEAIRNLHGMSYYLTKKGEQIVPEPNPNYRNLPEPKFLTAREFERRIRAER